MSENRELDGYVDELLRVSQRDATRRPGDPEWNDEAWTSQVRTLSRLIFRSGARAQLDYRLTKLVDPVDRVRWLCDNGLMVADVAEVVREVERLREVDRALLGAYGVTDGAIRSMISEGMHTAFRKGADSMESAIAWKAIKDMDHEEWNAIVSFVADPIVAMLREAEAAAKAAGQEPCLAEVSHGPGHQSSTRCELTGPHDVHRAIYGSQRQEATWRGPHVFTGAADEPPMEES